MKRLIYTQEQINWYKVTAAFKRSHAWYWFDYVDPGVSRHVLKLKEWKRLVKKSKSLDKSTEYAQFLLSNYFGQLKTFIKEERHAANKRAWNSQWSRK